MRPEEVGIFSPGVDEVHDAPVTTEGTLTIHKDVFAFESRIKDVALIHGADKAKKVLPKCLRGHASIWYCTILDDSTKNRLNGSEQSNWLLKLTDRFKKNTAQVFDAIVKERYTLEDIRKGVRPDDYISKAMYNAKSAGMTIRHLQLLAM